MSAKFKGSSKNVIARSETTKQSSLSLQKRDCFATLAMTQRIFRCGRNFWAVMLLLCCCPAFVQGQTDPNSWQKLNLGSTTIAGVKVYYEKSFEPNLSFFENTYKEFLSQKSQNDDVSNAKKKQILADINTILGVTEPNTAMQEKAWNFFNNVFSGITTFYLVKQSTTKDFLRKGGTLPNFTYDKTTDTASYNPQFTGSTKDGSIKNFEFAFPIASSETFEKDVTTIFQFLQIVSGQDIRIGTAIHEITEMTLIMRVKPTDPYWRWFSDGFAEAITYELLKKYIGIDSAEEYLKGRDPNEFKELKNEINLRYWPSAHFCLGEISSESEKKIEYARYAYATFEARRLVDKYGLDCIRRIMDEISAKTSRTGSDLLETIKNITGENMNARLAAYQSFEQRQQGIETYAKAFNETQAQKKLEQMVYNLFRIHELRRLVSDANGNADDSAQLMSDYRISAMLLLKLGLEKDADSVMENCIAFFSNPGFINGKAAASEAFVLYALESEKPLKARKAAEEILKTTPAHIPSLTVKIFADVEDKKISQARETAQKIVSISADPNSLTYKIASSFLAIDPNKLNVGK